MDKRTEVRFGANQPVIVSVAGSASSKNFPGNIAGASRSGLRIVAGTPIKVGVSVQVAWDAGTLVGEARYCRQILPDSYSIGLRIVSVSKRSKLRTRRLESES
jgi:hypothetical protein